MTIRLSVRSTVALRSLIGDVILMPGERRGEVNATLRGELLGIPSVSPTAGTRQERLF